MVLNPETNKSLKVLAILLAASFIIFLIGVAISIYFIFLAPINKETTYGTIVDIKNSTTTIKYTAEGRTYNKRFNAYSSTYYVGKKVKLYYNKQQPFNSSISSFRFLSLIGPGIGIVFMGVTGIMCIIYYKKEINV